jgi:hypothetical protein
MNKLKEAALSYAAKGWSVFPVQANKKPFEGTNGVLDATTDIKKIEEWWERWPRANVAMDVGSSGMMVLDYDPGHDFDQLEDNIGRVHDTPLSSNTPRGGAHDFYQLKDGEIIPPSASLLAPHVDVRSFHSYVLLPPSRTKDGAYTWERQGKPAFRSDGMATAAQATKERDVGWDDWIIEPDLDENIALAAKWLSEEAKPAVKGLNGDHMTYSTAAMMKSYGISEETAFDLLWEYWCPRCTPPWDSSGVENLEQKITNAFNYNTSPPGNMTPAYRQARHQELFKPVSRYTRGGGFEITAGRFRIVDRQGIDEIKPPKWLIKDALPEQSYSLLVAPPSSGKTFVALDMALSIATGAPFEDWHGAWPEVAQGAVVFAAGEGRGGIKNRIKAWEKEHNEGEIVKDFYLIDPVPHPDTEEIDCFIDAIDALGKDIALIVIDTVGRSMQGLNENAQQDASQFTRMVEEYTRSFNCAVLALHHTGHDNKARGRGSSVFEADADAVFVLEKDGETNKLFMKNTKQKDASEWEHPKVLHLKEVFVTKKTKSLVCHITSQELPKEEKKLEEAKHDKAKRAYGIDQQMLGKIVHEIIKKNPSAVYTQASLAEAVAVFKHEGESEPAIAQGSEALKRRPLTDLRESSHPAAKYYHPPMGSKKGYWSGQK